MSSVPIQPPAEAGRSRAAPAVAAALSLVLLALSGRYGPHRDELYFAVAGDHLQWGYPDQPPLTPLVAALASHLAPGSLLALRLLPALLAGAVVLLAVGITRELGGDRRAQLLTAVTVGTAGALLAVGHLLSTSTIDLFFWVLISRLVIHVLHRDARRGWLWVGLAAGVGLENKSLLAALLGGLVLGIALTPSLRHHLRAPQAWAGAAIALLIWAPNLWWQAAHGWPQFALGADIRDEYGTFGGLAQLLGFQFLLLNPLGGLLALRGLLRSRALVAARPVVIAYPALLVLFGLTGGKAYYLIGLLVPLAAIGSIGLLHNRFRSGVALTAVALTALFPVPAMLPVLPAGTFAGSFYPALNADGLETIGWPAVVGQVRAAAATLPANAVVVTQNYGEAGALEWYRQPGDRPVYSGHNGFGDWGPPPENAGPVVYVGFAPDPAALAGCRRLSSLTTGVDNEESENAIFVCTGPVGGWARAWARIRHLDA